MNRNMTHCHSLRTVTVTVHVGDSLIQADSWLGFVTVWLWVSLSVIQCESLTLSLLSQAIMSHIRGGETHSQTRQSSQSLSSESESGTQLSLWVSFSLMTHSRLSFQSMTDWLTLTLTLTVTLRHTLTDTVKPKESRVSRVTHKSLLT